MKAFERQVRWMHDLARKRVKDQLKGATELVREDCEGCMFTHLPEVRPHTCTAEVSKIQNVCSGHMRQLDELLEVILLMEKCL